MTDESQKILAMRRHNQYYLHPFGWVVSSVVEQLAFNQLVVGSNPTRPTIRTCRLVYEPWVVSSVVEQLAFNQLVVGSTPTRPTTYSTRKAPLWRFSCFFLVCGDGAGMPVPGDDVDHWRSSSCRVGAWCVNMV